jgi:glycine/D-amino acid oxidase-like deaminating enzyme
VKKILVAGQGIAGTVLAWTLRARGATVVLADAGYPEISSAVAAGIINPVTGKRFVKSWRFDECYAAARRTYQSMEAALGVRAWYDLPILRLLNNTEEVNNWAARAGQPDYTGLVELAPDPGLWANFVLPGFRYGLVPQAARVDFSALMCGLRDLAIRENWYLPREITHAETEQLAAEYDHVIFCEGYRAFSNPFFPGLGWQLAKGEALLVRFPGDNQSADIRTMLKKSMMMVPLGDGVFWAGGSYNWTFDGGQPTAGEREYILNGLHDMLRAPFEIVGHRAAVRPTVKDRRPFIGLNAANPKIGIFNGMGTKGALLTPYWAEHFADHLLEGTALDPTVDIQRFSARQGL